MKKILPFFLIALLGFIQPGCVAILAGGAGAAAAYWYSQNHLKCPHCKKQISTQASICRHCKNDVTPTEPLTTEYRETVFGKVVCVYCRELINKKATVCPKCQRNVEPLREGEPTRDVLLKKISCPTCHKKISDKATVCPHCQSDIS